MRGSYLVDANVNALRFKRLPQVQYRSSTGVLLALLVPVVGDLQLEALGLKVRASLPARARTRTGRVGSDSNNVCAALSFRTQRLLVHVLFVNFRTSTQAAQQKSLTSTMSH